METKKTNIFAVALTALLVLAVCPAAPAVGSNGLVAHWTFDEGEGTTAYDSVGTNHGMLVNGPTWTSGVVGGALDFDGASDYVDVGDTLDSFLVTDYTISAWFKRHTYSSTQTILAYRDSPVGNASILFQFNSNYGGGNLTFVVRDSAWNMAYGEYPVELQMDRWYHIVGVRNGGNVNIYVDSEPGTPDFNTFGVIAPDSFVIGTSDKADPLDGNLDGAVDEVLVYDRVLSVEEIEQLYEAAGSGLVAHWRFDEGEGTTAYDSVGTNHGMLVNGPTWTSGVVGGALDFDGASDYVDVGDTLDSCLATDYTISAWFKRHTYSSNQAILGYRDSPVSNASVLFQFNSNYGNGSGNLTFVVRDSAWNMAYGEYFVDLQTDRWYHIAGVRNGGDVNIYVDSEPGTPDFNTFGVIAPDSFVIGTLDKAEPFGANLDGAVDEVLVYNRALSVEDIEELYEAAVPDVNEGAAYYVDGVNGSDLNDGLTLETAFATVQKGIDMAQDADTVLVYPAVYSEAINFKGKAITVRGVATPDGIAVIQTPSDFAVFFYNGEGPDSVLKNFVITNSEMAGFLAEASPTLSCLTVVENDFGIGAYGLSEPDIRNCIFYNNLDGDLYQCQAQYSWFPQEANAPAAGLIAHWAFDEGEGTTAYDSAGTNDGTLVNGPTWTTGLLAGALRFDGLDDYVESGNNLVPPGGTITVSAWVNSDAPGDYDTHRRIVSQWGPEVGSFQLFYDGRHDSIPGFDFELKADSQKVLNSGYLLTPGEWYFAAGTYDGAKQRIYVNGLEEANVPNTGPIQWGGQDTTRIGRDCTSSYFFDGVIDDVRIYEQALSAEQVHDLYLWDGNTTYPMFADATGGDYHLKSERGRHWPEHNVWVLDGVTSPCIDGGDPNVEPSDEPTPNGGRLNTGAYGNTPYASMSEWAIPEDTNRDGVVNWLDFALLAGKWLEALAWAQ